MGLLLAQRVYQIEILHSQKVNQSLQTHCHLEWQELLLMKILENLIYQLLQDNFHSLESQVNQKLGFSIMNHCTFYYLFRMNAQISVRLHHLNLCLIIHYPKLSLRNQLRNNLPKRLYHVPQKLLKVSYSRLFSFGARVYFKH